MRRLLSFVTIAVLIILMCGCSQHLRLADGPSIQFGLPGLAQRVDLVIPHHLLRHPGRVTIGQLPLEMYRQRTLGNGDVAITLCVGLSCRSIDLGSISVEIGGVSVFKQTVQIAGRW